jgi:hypothetical protein
LLLRAAATIEGKGYYPPVHFNQESQKWTAESKQHAAALTQNGQRLLALPSITSEGILGNHPENYSVVHFFLEEKYLGAVGNVGHIERIAATGASQITIDYLTYGPNDPFCCHTVRGSVDYIWTGDMLIASEDPPQPWEDPQLRNLSGRSQVELGETRPLTVLFSHVLGGVLIPELLLPAKTAITVDLWVYYPVIGEYYAMQILGTTLRSPDVVDQPDAAQPNASFHIIPTISVEPYMWCLL